ncbi:type II toxin-antitoxin system Phd/YefM family antitoxin [Amantichitinum ursilacus]|uniref:Antitoxin n=1 Tax=Amantichitinum ursilacus TaxID=857265 RepID=A0A0N0GL02_9NEIS|nr:type II toxin-antitoxin system prevent-host-death family antitoxin [Amantichitinum ursilacus]KPC49325.1 Antitoxin YefM [Amantichitinum ursilacus]
MDAVTYTYARQHLAEVMRKVNEDCCEVIVTSQRGKPVVIMALSEYQALEETAYLLRTPESAIRLLEAVLRMKAGEGEEHALIEDDDESHL